MAETFVERQMRLVLEQQCSDIGRRLALEVPAGTGFVLALFDFGEGGNFAYISNGDRPGVLTMLRDLLRRVSSEKKGSTVTSGDCPCCHQCLSPGEDTDTALVAAFLSGLTASIHKELNTSDVLCARHSALADEAIRFVSRHGRRG